MWIQSHILSIQSYCGVLLRNNCDVCVYTHTKGLGNCYILFIFLMYCITRGLLLPPKTNIEIMCLNVTCLKFIPLLYFHSLTEKNPFQYCYSSLVSEFISYIKHGVWAHILTQNSLIWKSQKLNRDIYECNV